MVESVRRGRSLTCTCIYRPQEGKEEKAGKEEKRGKSEMVAKF